MLNLRTVAASDDLDGIETHGYLNFLKCIEIRGSCRTWHAEGTEAFHTADIACGWAYHVTERGDHSILDGTQMGLLVRGKITEVGQSISVS